jgi:hypothetical protein
VDITIEAPNDPLRQAIFQHNLFDKIPKREDDKALRNLQEKIRFMTKKDGKKVTMADFDAEETLHRCYLGYLTRTKDLQKRLQQIQQLYDDIHPEKKSRQIHNPIGQMNKLRQPTNTKATSRPRRTRPSVAQTLPLYVLPPLPQPEAVQVKRHVMSPEQVFVVSGEQLLFDDERTNLFSKQHAELLSALENVNDESCLVLARIMLEKYKKGSTHVPWIGDVPRHLIADASVLDVHPSIALGSQVGLYCFSRIPDSMKSDWPEKQPYHLVLCSFDILDAHPFEEDNVTRLLLPIDNWYHTLQTAKVALHPLLRQVFDNQFMLNTAVRDALGVLAYNRVAVEGSTGSGLLGKYSS